MKLKFTELNSGYKGEKNVSRFSPKTRSKAIIIGVLAVAFVFVYLLSSFGVIPLGAILVRAKTAVSGDSQRFPITINTESTLNTEVIGDSILVLTTENVTVYSPKGKEVFSQPHVFTKPAVSVNGDRAVVFDRGGKGFMLLTDKKIVFEGNAENTVITAEYGKNGSYALGTRSKNATSTLTVYNKNNKSVFQWNCAYEHIVSIALSNNGKYIGAAVIGAENGEIFTTVQYFGLEYKEPLNTQKITSACALDLEFTSYGKLTLISDKGVYTVDRKSEKYTETLKYYSTEFNSCDISSDGHYIVSLAKYGSENVFEILLYKPKGELKTTISADFEIKSAYISDKYIFALTEKSVIVYNYGGKIVSEFDFKGDAHSLLPTDGYIFIISLDKITRCFTYGESTVEL